MSPEQALIERATTPITVKAAVAFLEESARYFERRPTKGEDAAYWANVANADTCRRIAALLSTPTQPTQ